MISLRNKFTSIITLLFLVSCKTKDAFEIKVYNLNNEPNALNLVTVNPKNIVHECIFLNAEAENKWRYQYMMYILNDQKEVIPVMYAIHQEKSVCNEHLKKVEKIIKQNDLVKLCLREILKNDSTSAEYIKFGQLGKFPIKFEPLTFGSICSANKCYNSNSAWTHTCPGFQISND